MAKNRNKKKIFFSALIRFNSMTEMDNKDTSYPFDI